MNEPTRFRGELPPAAGSRPLLVALAVLVAWVFLLAGNATGAEPSAPESPVRLHPQLADCLQAAEAARFGLFQDVEGLQAVVFYPAPWGGYLARLEVVTPAGVVWRERNVSTSTWRQWQARVAALLAGAPALPDSTADGVAPADTLPPDIPPPADRIRVWPEVPLPPALPRVAPADTLPLAIQPMSGRWFVLLEVGYRHNTSEFGRYFSDEGMFALTWGRMLGRVMPFFALDVGFGDITKAYESITADGRANTYGFALGLLVRQPLSERVQFYASGAGGYFIRSLQWGGTFYDPYTGTYASGLVQEQQDWGTAFRLGFLVQRKSRDKARFIDIGVSLQTTRADEWIDEFDGIDPPVKLRAAGPDTWLTISVRFGDNL